MKKGIALQLLATKKLNILQLLEIEKNIVSDNDAGGNDDKAQIEFSLEIVKNVNFDEIEEDVLLLVFEVIKNRLFFDTPLCDKIIAAERMSSKALIKIGFELAESRFWNKIINTGKISFIDLIEIGKKVDKSYFWYEIVNAWHSPENEIEISLLIDVGIKANCDSLWEKIVQKIKSI